MLYWKVIAILKAFYNDNSYQRDKAAIKKDLFHLFQNERYFTYVKNHLKTPEEIKQFIVTLLTWGDDNRLSLLKVKVHSYFFVKILFLLKKLKKLT